MSNFRPTDRLTGFLMPPSVDEWLPQRHLARFVVEVVDGLDLSAMSKSYRGSGSACYHPAALLSLLVYGYATGGFSSRKLERATYDSVAFRFIAGNDHADHDTIATFRRGGRKGHELRFSECVRPSRRCGGLNDGAGDDQADGPHVSGAARAGRAEPRRGAKPALVGDRAGVGRQQPGERRPSDRDGPGGC